MGRDMLVDGEWKTGFEPETGEDGAFERATTTFRDQIDDGGRFPPGAGRYHLYISRACPWAHGAVLVRNLLGLGDILSMDVVDPWRGEDGWRFTPGKDGCTRDTVNDADYLREVYTRADPDYTGRVSVPVLWDREEETIVNNESIEIMRMLNDAFAEERRFDLLPSSHRDRVLEIIDEIYAPINNGVYRAGFATSQEAYDTAVTDLFDALAHWDSVLQDQRWLAGERLTLADIRLFPTLIRFDHVYHTHFKCNRKLIQQYDALWPYLRDLYQLPGVAGTVNMDHIKEHYYTTHPGVNPNGIIPIGPVLDLDKPHGREDLGDVPEALQ